MDDYFSKYQHIEIQDICDIGKILVIDSELQFAEMDEFMYHEMFCFPTLASHKSPLRVLIIGGVDLLLPEQIIKSPDVQHVD